MALAGRFGATGRIGDLDAVFGHIGRTVADAVRQGGHPEQVTTAALEQFGEVRRAVGNDEWADWLAHGGDETTVILPDGSRYRVGTALVLPSEGVREARVPAQDSIRGNEMWGTSWDPEADVRVTSYRDQSTDWNINASVTDAIAAGSHLTVAPGLKLSGDHSTSHGLNEMSVSTTRGTTATGAPVWFQFPDAHVRVSVTQEGAAPSLVHTDGNGSAAAVRSAPFDVRVGVPASHTPLVSADDEGRPIPPGRDDVVLPAHGARPAEVQQRLDDALWTHRVSTETIDGLEGLHSRVLDRLPADALESGSESWWRLRRFLSERTQLHQYSHHAGIGHASEEFPLKGGAGHLGVTVRTQLVSARSVNGADVETSIWQQQRLLTLSGLSRTESSSGGLGVELKVGPVFGKPGVVKGLGVKPSFNLGGSVSRSLELDTGSGLWQKLSTTGPTTVYELGIRLTADLRSDLPGVRGVVSYPGTVHIRIPVADAPLFEDSLRQAVAGGERPSGGPAPSAPRDLALLPSAIRERRGVGPSYVELGGSARSVQQRVLDLLIEARQERGLTALSPMQEHHLHRQLAVDFSLSGFSPYGGQLFTPRGMRRVLELPDGNSAVITVVGRFDPQRLLHTGVRSDRTVSLVRSMAHSIDYSQSQSYSRKISVDVAAKFGLKFLTAGVLDGVGLNGGYSYSRSFAESLSSQDFAFTADVPTVEGPARWFAYDTDFDITVTVGSKGEGALRSDSAPQDVAASGPDGRTMVDHVGRRVVDASRITRTQPLTTRRAVVDGGSVVFWTPDQLVFDGTGRRSQAAMVSADPRAFRVPRQEREQLRSDDQILSLAVPTELGDALTDILTRTSSFRGLELASVVDHLTHDGRLLNLFQRGTGGDGSAHTELLRTDKFLREHHLVVRIRASVNRSLTTVPGVVHSGKLVISETTPTFKSGTTRTTVHSGSAELDIVRALSPAAMRLPDPGSAFDNSNYTVGAAGSYSRSTSHGAAVLHKVTSGGMVVADAVPHEHRFADVVYTLEVEHRREWTTPFGQSNTKFHELRRIQVPDGLEFLRRVEEPVAARPANVPATLDSRQALQSAVPYTLRFADEHHEPESNPVIDAVVDLLREHRSAFRQLAGDIADSYLPLAAEARLVQSLHQILSPSSLAAAIRRMQSTGLRLTPLGAEAPYYVEIKATPGGELTHSGSRGEMSVGRYINTFNWQVATKGAGRSWSGTASGSSTVLMAGPFSERDASESHTWGAARSGSSTLNEGATLIDRVMFNPGSQLYSGPMRITVGIKKVVQPSPVLANRLFGGLPDRVRVAYHRAADPRMDGVREVSMVQEIAVPDALFGARGPLAHPARPQVRYLRDARLDMPELFSADGGPLTAVSDSDHLGQGVKPFPLVGHELADAVLKRDVVLMGLDDLSVREMHQEFLARLRGDGDGRFTLRFSGPELLTEWGTGAEEALHDILSSHFLSGFFDRTVSEAGYSSPALVRNGGTFTDTHGQITVRATLYNPTPLDWVDVNHELEDNVRSRQATGAAVSRSYNASLSYGLPLAAGPSDSVGVGRTTARNEGSGVTTHALLGAGNAVERPAQKYLQVRVGILYSINIESANHRGVLSYGRQSRTLEFRLDDSGELLVHPDRASLFQGVPDGHPVAKNEASEPRPPLPDLSVDGPEPIAEAPSSNDASADWPSGPSQANTSSRSLADVLDPSGSSLPPSREAVAPPQATEVDGGAIDISPANVDRVLGKLPEHRADEVLTAARDFLRRERGIAVPQEALDLSASGEQALRLRQVAYVLHRHGQDAARALADTFAPPTGARASVRESLPAEQNSLAAVLTGALQSGNRPPAEPPVPARAVNAGPSLVREPLPEEPNDLAAVLNGARPPAPSASPAAVRAEGGAAPSAVREPLPKQQNSVGAVLSGDRSIVTDPSAVRHPADRNLLSTMRREAPWEEVRRRFVSRSAEEQQRLLQSADHLLRVRPVIGRDAAATAARMLHTEARVRLGEALADGFPRAKALAHRLGMSRWEGLRGGSDTPAPPSGTPGGGSYEQLGVVPAQVVSAGLVLSGIPEHGRFLSVLTSHPADLAVLMWVDPMGRVVVPRADGVAPLVADARGLVRTMAINTTLGYAQAEILRLIVEGRTPQNDALVIDLLQQVADLSQRSVWLPALGNGLALHEGFFVARAGDHPGIWQEIVPDSGPSSAWTSRPDGLLLRNPQVDSLPVPNWGDHLLAGAGHPERIVLASVLTRAGDLRIPMPDGLLQRIQEAEELIVHLDEHETDQQRPVELIQLHLPTAVGGADQPRLAAAAADLAELVGRTVAYPGPGARSMVVGDDVRLTAPDAATRQWHVARPRSVFVPWQSLRSDAAGFLLRDDNWLPMVMGLDEEGQTDLLAERGIDSPAARLSRIVVHAEAGPDGEFVRPNRRDVYQPVTPEELVEEILGGPWAGEDSIVQLLVPDGVPAAVHPAFLAHTRELAELVGRTVAAPPPDTVVDVDRRTGDLVVHAGEWVVVPPPDGPTAGFRTDDNGRLWRPGSVVVDAHGNEWSRDDLFVIEGAHEQVSLRAMVGPDAPEDFGLREPEDGQYALHLDVDESGRPTLVSVMGESVVLPPPELVRVLFPRGLPEEQLAVHVQMDPAVDVAVQQHQVYGMVSWLHDFAAETNRSVIFSWQRDGGLDAVSPLPEGYRYTGWEPDRGRPGSLQMPGGVSALASEATTAGRWASVVAQSWSARMSDRPDGLFLAQVLRYRAGEFLLPGSGRPATASEVADWVRAHGWQPGEALQLVWGATEGRRSTVAAQSDVTQARQIAEELGVSVYLAAPGSSVEPLHNGRSSLAMRDIVVVGEGGRRGAWQRVDRLGPIEAGFVDDAYGRLVRPGEQLALALTPGGIALSPARAHRGRPVSQRHFYDVSLVIGPTGVPIGLQTDGSLRAAEPAEVVAAMTRRAAPAEPSSSGGEELDHVWRGQNVRLLTRSPAPGPAHEAFRAWTERLQQLLGEAVADRPSSGAGTVRQIDIYAPEAGAAIGPVGDISRQAEVPIAVRWPESGAEWPPAQWVRLGSAEHASPPALFATDQNGVLRETQDLVFRAADSGAVVSAATSDGAYTDHRVIATVGLHGGRQHGIDPFGMPAFDSLLPVELMVGHDGALALMRSDGVAHTVQVRELARMLQGPNVEQAGRLWNGSDDLQILSRFTVGPQGAVTFEGPPLSPHAAHAFATNMRTLAELLGTDVYFAVAEGGGGAAPRRLEQAGMVIAAGAGREPGHWERAVGRTGPPRFTTNSFGALVPEWEVPGDLWREGLRPAEVHTETFAGGMSLVLGYHADAARPQLPSAPGRKLPGPSVWGKAATDGEFLVMADGARDAVGLYLPGLDRPLTAGPEALMQVLHRSGWDGSAQIRLAVDHLAFSEPVGTGQPSPGEEVVPGVRFGQTLADLAGVTVHAPTGRVDWVRAAEGYRDGDLLPLEAERFGTDRSHWVTYEPTGRTVTWPSAESARRRLEALRTDTRARLLSEAQQIMEDFAGAPLTMSSEGTQNVTRSAVERVAHVLRWVGPAEADRLARLLVEQHGPELAPMYTVLELGDGTAASTVERWLADGGRTAVSLLPQGTPGGVLVRFPAGAAEAPSAGAGTSRAPAWVVPARERFTILDAIESPVAGLPAFQLADPPPAYAPHTADTRPAEHDAGAAEVDGALLRYPADRELWGRMADERLSWERVRGAFRSRPGEQQARLLTAAEPLLRVRPVIGQDAADTAARALHTQARVRLAEAYGQSADAAWELAGRLGMRRVGGLRGGLPTRQGDDVSDGSLSQDGMSDYEMSDSALSDARMHGDPGASRGPQGAYAPEAADEGSFGMPELISDDSSAMTDESSLASTDAMSDLMLDAPGNFMPGRGPAEGPVGTLDGALDMQSGTPTEILSDSEFHEGLSGPGPAPAQAVPGGVVISANPEHTMLLLGLMPHEHSQSVVLWVDAAGRPQVPSRIVGRIATDPVGLVRAIALSSPHTYGRTEVIQAQIIGLTEQNRPAVRTLLEQIAELTQRPVWTSAAGSELRLFTGTFEAVTAGGLPGQWEQITVPGGMPSEWRASNGRLHRPLLTLGTPTPTWDSHVLSSPEPGRAVVTAMFTRAGELRIPLPDGSLRGVSEAGVLAAHLERREDATGTPISLVQLHLPNGANADNLGLLAEAAELHQVLGRHIAVPGPQSRSELSGDVARVRAWGRGEVRWELVSSEPGSAGRYVTGTEGLLHEADTPLPMVLGPQMQPAHMALSPFLAARVGERPTQIVVHSEIGFYGEFTRVYHDGSRRPVPIEEMARQVEEAMVAGWYTADAPVQLLVPMPVGRAVYPEFLSAAVDLADRIGRSVYLPPPDIAVEVRTAPDEQARPDLVLRAGSWQEAVPADRPSAGFLSSPDGRLWAPSAVVSDVAGRHWFREDVRLAENTRATVSRAGYPLSALRRLAVPPGHPQLHVFHLDVSRDGTPALGSVTNEHIELPPDQFARLFWPQGHQDTTMPVISVEATAVDQVFGLVAWVHDLATEIGKQVAFSWSGDLRIDAAEPLPQGYRYVGRDMAGGGRAGSVELPGGVSALAARPEHAGTATAALVEVWSARLAERADGLFLAQLLREGPGRLRVSGTDAAPASARQIAQWVRAHGLQPGHELQLIWSDLTSPVPTPATPEDVALATEIAAQLGTSVYLPDHGSSAAPPHPMLEEGVVRDFVSVDESNGTRGSWQRIPPPGAEHTAPRFTGDPYGRLVPVDSRPAFALTERGVVLAPARLPVPGPEGVPAAHPALYDLALSLGEDGVPLVRQADGVERPATAAEVADVMVRRTLPAEPAVAGPEQTWRGHDLRLLVETPPSGARLDRFQEWARELHRLLTDAAPADAADGSARTSPLVHMYAPEPSAATVAGDPTPVDGAARQQVVLSRPGGDAEGTLPAPRWELLTGDALPPYRTALQEINPSDGVAFYPTGFGSLLSAGTLDGGLSDFRGVQQYGVHWRGPVGDDAFAVPGHEGLLPLDTVIGHDGSLALILTDGRPHPVTPAEFARMLRGPSEGETVASPTEQLDGRAAARLWNGSDDLQILGRFRTLTNGNVTFESTPLSPTSMATFHASVQRLAELLGTDVYAPAPAESPAPRHVESPGASVLSRLDHEAGAVVVAGTDGSAGGWHRAVGRPEAPPRFATNSYGALVPVTAVRIDELAQLGMEPTGVPTERFAGGVALPAGLPVGSAKAEGPDVWRRAAPVGEFLVVARGERDGVQLSSSEGEFTFTAGPEPVLAVIRRAGWDGTSPLRLAVDGLAFTEGRGWDALPGVRFAQRLADLAGTTVFATSGTIHWDEISHPVQPAQPPPLVPGSGDWFSYLPQSDFREPPTAAYAASRLGKLHDDALHTLLHRASRIVEDFAGAPLALGTAEAPTAVRNTVVRVAHALRWSGAAEADRLAMALVAEQRSTHAPVHAALDVAEGVRLSDPQAVEAAVTAWLADGGPVPTTRWPQAEPGQVLVRFPAGAAGLPGTGTLHTRGVEPPLDIASRERFTVRGPTNSPLPGVAAVQLVEAPPMYASLLPQAMGPQHSHYVEASGIIRQYGSVPPSLPGHAGVPAGAARRRLIHDVHEQVAEALFTHGADAAHQRARDVVRQHGWGPSSDLTQNARGEATQELRFLAPEDRFLVQEGLQPEVRSALIAQVREVAREGLAFDPLAVGRRAVAELRHQGLIPPDVRGTVMEPVTVEGWLRIGEIHEADLRHLPGVWEQIRQRTLDVAARFGHWGETRDGWRAVRELRAEGVIPSEVMGWAPDRDTTQHWWRRRLRLTEVSEAEYTELADTVRLLAQEHHITAPDEALARAVDSMRARGMLLHQQGRDLLPTAVLEEWMEHGAQGNRHLPDASASQQAALPDMEAGGPQQTQDVAQRWERVAAAAAAGRLTPEHLAAARTLHPMQVLLDLRSGESPSDTVEAWLRGGTPAFGAKAASDRIVTGQIAVEFPFEASYDLGALEASGADGTLVVPSPHEYTVSAVMPDYPVPGAVWVLVEREGGPR
ncbi:hypothetical protein [Streptomyces lydicus]|uniref:hypothetical protein n=1 Tax=Streptomyces lydicus TaxID=47763 RepID=UPI0036E06180